MTHPTHVDALSIHAFPERNTRRDTYRDPAIDNDCELSKLLAKGHLPSEGPYAIYPLSVGDKALAKAQRKATIAQWRKRDKIEVPRGKEEKMVVLIDGNLIADVLESAPAIEWGASDHNRRLGAMPCAIAIREHGLFTKSPEISAKDGTLFVSAQNNTHYPVPCRIVPAPDSAEHTMDNLIDHVRENTQKDAGAVPYSPLDYVHIARMVLTIKGGKEADLMRMGITRHLAIKTFLIARVDKLCPKLHLIDRLFADPKGADAKYAPGGYIPYRPLEPKDLRELIETDDNGKETVDLELAEDAIKKRLTSTGGDKKGTKMMSKTDIEKLANKNASLLVGAILTAVSTNQVAFLRRAAKCADAIDAAAIKAGLVKAE